MFTCCFGSGSGIFGCVRGSFGCVRGSFGCRRSSFGCGRAYLGSEGGMALGGFLLGSSMRNVVGS